MPRKPRFNLVGIPQHVIQGGNNRVIRGLAPIAAIAGPYSRPLLPHV